MPNIPLNFCNRERDKMTIIDEINELSKQRDKNDNIILVLIIFLIALVIGGWLSLFFMCQYTFGDINSQATRKETINYFDDYDNK